MGAVLPDDDEVAALVPGPASITWERASDARGFIAAGYALMLQVAHPTVGAGVADHSNFREDPWGRLLRTLDFTNGLIYADPRTAAAIGRAVRGMHKRIKGRKPDGTPYHALEPEPYAWVHITLFDAIVRAHGRFGRPFTAPEVERFYGEWLRLGRLLGVREGDLPQRYAGFPPYFDRMLREVLQPNPTVYDVLDSLSQPTAPPLPAALRRAWKLGAPALARGQRLATIGLLPPILAKRLGLRLTRRERLELRAFAAAARSATPLMPEWLLHLGPGYLRWREDPVRRLVAAGADRPEGEARPAGAAAA